MTEPQMTSAVTATRQKRQEFLDNIKALRGQAWAESVDSYAFIANIMPVLAARSGGRAKEVLILRPLMNRIHDLYIRLHGEDFLAIQRDAIALASIVLAGAKQGAMKP